MPWNLRPQSARGHGELVEVVMGKDAYDVMVAIRSRILDQETPFEEKQRGMDELHTLFELHHHFPGTEGSVPVSARLPNPEENRIGRFNNPALSKAPETQRVSAVLVYYKSGSDRQAVLAEIALSGEVGMTDFEIEESLVMRHQTASARRNDLMNDGWIEDSGLRRLTDSGRPAVAWILTTQGRSQWNVAK